VLAPSYLKSASTVRKKAGSGRLVGLRRRLFIALLALLAAFLAVSGRGALRALWALALGVGVPAAHATVRSPNLKARLASAREEFRAVW
jgi:hypothetical protein